MNRTASRDNLKLLFVALIVLFLGFIFIWSSSLRPTFFLTILNLILLTPIIRKLEKRKFSRTNAIILVFAISAFVVVFGITNGVHLIRNQWTTLVQTLPAVWLQIVNKISALQNSVLENLGVSVDIGASDWMLRFGSDTQSWILTHLPTLLGDAASAAFLVPIFSFFILRDGKEWRARFYALIPKKYYDTTIEVLHETTVALEDFIRAKVIEATSVGLLAFIGLLIVGAPYAGLFAFIVGITNIIPYLGQILGAIAPLALYSMTDSMNQYFWPALIVLIIVNVVDNLLIFPLFVAKIVNLSPLTLLAAVAVGQEYYGLVGMLIAVPLASIIKIIYQEVVTLLYGTE
ncbi:MAG: AI-2E family transporter [Bdellovibrionales bacterium]|nr:AI-2E family transporter [Bdellovibrionales bacterium]